MNNEELEDKIFQSGYDVAAAEIADLQQELIEATARGDAYQALAEELLDGDPGMRYWPGDAYEGGPVFSGVDVKKFRQKAKRRNDER